MSSPKSRSKSQKEEVADDQKELKDDEEKKENKLISDLTKEELPDLGGSKRLNKEFGQKYIWYTVGGYIFAFLNGCMMPLFGVLFREILNVLDDSINEETGETNFEQASFRVMWFWFAMGSGCGIFTILQFYFFGTYGTKTAIEVRKQYFAAVIAQDISYHDQETSSKINSLLTTETTAIEAGIGTKLGFAVQQVSSFLVGMALAFIYSWRLTLVLLVSFPVLMIIGLIQGKLFAQMGQNSDPFVHAGSFAQEILTNIRTVLAFPSLVKSKYEGYLSKIKEGFPISTKKTMLVGFSLGFFMFGMMGICYAFGLYAGARFVDEGWLEVDDLFGCFFCFMIGGMAIGQMGSVMGDIQNANIGANRFYFITERQAEIRKPDPEIGAPRNPNEKLSGNIEFENVSFAYKTAPDLQVLRNISFEVRAGETLAIVGPSGSGKSTIISLIERFYDPNEGNIYIDNKSKECLIHNFDVSYLRSQIGLVSQMPLLFDATVRENIAGGNSNATDDDIVGAAKLANAHDFITKLPKGYDTSVGELGGRVSGGQKQRIAIARAILSKPSVLLLDEATSALDSKSEKEVQDAIDQISSTRNQTVIAIAHRLSTIKDYDQIIVLVDGSIRERGNHDVLMEKNGVYAALVRAQSLVEDHKKQHIQRQSSVPSDIAMSP